MGSNGRDIRRPVRFRDDWLNSGDTAMATPGKLPRTALLVLMAAPAIAQELELLADDITNDGKPGLLYGVTYGDKYWLQFEFEDGGKEDIEMLVEGCGGSRSDAFLTLDPHGTIPMAINPLVEAPPGSLPRFLWQWACSQEASQ